MLISILIGLLKMLGISAIPAVFEYLGDLALKSIANPTSNRARALYAPLRAFDNEIDRVLEKIKLANPDLD